MAQDTQEMKTAMVRPVETAPAPNPGTAIAQTRAQAEVQGMMVMARANPRDEMVSLEKITRSCQRPLLAEKAMYSYPKGNTTVTGPSIQLIKEVARCFGNIDYGVQILSSDSRESTVLVYALDLENMTRETRSFRVPHERHTRSGVYEINDPREIYEHVANYSSRRLRACIEGVLPKDLVDHAIQECEETLRSRHKVPLHERAKKMVKAFGEIGVPVRQLESILGHSASNITENDYVKCQGIYRSIRDGETKVDDWFKKPKEEEEAAYSPPTEPIDTRPKKTAPKKKKEPEPEPEPPAEEEEAGNDETEDDDLPWKDIEKAKPKMYGGSKDDLKKMIEAYYEQSVEGTGESPEDVWDSMMTKPIKVNNKGVKPPSLEWVLAKDDMDLLQAVADRAKEYRDEVMS